MSRIIKYKVQFLPMDGEPEEPRYSHDQFRFNKAMNEYARWRYLVALKSRKGRMPRKAKKEMLKLVHDAINQRIDERLKELDGEIND